ncbi:MAG: GntR family transcriptional regulator [Leptolyngbyaceae cyanobacterium SL_5_14]|nr:GntR family transcriptional regulator [Leptolyngbyaceae cyanobacterium SL_5_14]
MPIPKTEVLSRTFMRDDVYQSLREWIVSGDLKPDEKLKDKDLAAQLGVSRTPVREALRKLEDEGLVKTAANRWTQVAPITIRDAECIYPIIQALEELALTLAFPKFSAQHIQCMQNANDDLKSALNNNDPHAAMCSDALFHQNLIDAANNTELSTILEQLKVKCKRIELAYFSDADLLLASFEEHQRLISALETKDFEAANQALAGNWQASIERLRIAGGQ